METDISIGDENFLYIQNMTMKTNRFLREIIIRTNEQVNITFNNEKMIFHTTDNDVCKADWEFIGIFTQNSSKFLENSESDVKDISLDNKWEWSWGLISDKKSIDLKNQLKGEIKETLLYSCINFSEPFVLTNILSIVLECLNGEYLYFTNTIPKKYSYFVLKNIEWLMPINEHLNKLYTVEFESDQNTEEPKKLPKINWKALFEKYSSLFSNKN